MPFAFFGLCLEPEKTYSQTVSKSFRISMASFGENILSNGERSCVKVEVDGEEFVLCSLNPGSNEQQTLDVVFETDEEITLSATGKNSVHLTGNYLPEEDYEHDHDHDDMEYDSAEYESADSDEMEEGDEDYSDEEEVTKEDLDRLRALIASHAEDDDEDSEEDPDFFESQEDEDDEEDLEEGDEEEDLDEEMSDAKPIEVGQKRKAEKASPIADKKMKDNTAAAVKTVQPTKVEKAPKAEKKLENSAATPTSDAQAPSDKPLSKKQKKAAAAKARAEQEAEKAKAKPEEKAAEVQKTKAKPEEKATESPMKKVLGNGLQIEDVKVGTGVRAKKGKKVGVRYIGKLVSNGKVFDKNVAGKPFTFNLGRGEVIKGWDMGVDGMSVGGERRLVIPAVLAYGARGAPPDIPKNATLEFEVKLLSVN